MEYQKFGAETFVTHSILKLLITSNYSGWPNYYSHFAFVSHIKSPNIDYTHEEWTFKRA